MNDVPTTPAPAATIPSTAPVLWRYLALSYLGILLHYAAYLTAVPFKGAMTAFFATAVALSGPLWLMLPVFLPVLGIARLLRIDRIARLFRRAPWVPAAGVYTLGVGALSLVHVFIFADRFIFHVYGFHINGFVWNLVTTRGGIDSMGAGESTVLSAGLTVAGFVALQAGLLAAVLFVPKLRTAAPRVFSRRGFLIAFLALFGLIAFEKITYGWSRFKLRTPVLAAADPFPFYVRCDLTRPAKALGFKGHGKSTEDLAIGSEALRIKYPRAPIQRDPSKPRYNVVWMVSESWRHDMLDPEIMPATYAFAKDSLWFRHHYSGGNGTRTGVFSMFYGLYGPYWFPFLAEKRGPVFMDLILQEGYKTWFQTSQSFSYPEFDQTVFSRIPRDQLHEASVPGRWERDRESLVHLLKFIETRTPGEPFFMFMFFESPHAPYTFPEECAIRKPYIADFNYLTAKLDDAQGIKNRYINACHHLDTQVARVLDALKKKGLMDDTIILFTGDHGEEFMEKGRWGHNSEFSEEQTRVPLILHLPGRKPEEITRLTSHLDLPATMMTLLGVTTPPEEYSLGVDLLGPTPRAYTVVSDWDHLCYVDLENKGVFSLKNWQFRQKISTSNDAPVADSKAFVEKNRTWLLRIMQDMGRFKQ